jgi:hypothetical protein
MAVTESQLTSGHRLAGDLRSIRRKKGVDLKEVLDATRLADDVIENLEENGLVNHPTFNKVYLRSLYGAYGDAISVRREHMLQALEEVFSGNYVGSLARKYLGSSSPEDHAEPVDPDAMAAEDPAGEAEGAQEDAAPEDNASNTAPEASSEATGETDPSDDHDVAEDTPAAKGEERRLVRSTLHEQRMDDRVWQGIPDKGRVLLPNMNGTALVAIAALAFIALIWFAVLFLLGMGDAELDDYPAQDTSRVAGAFRPDPVVLPDSFRVDIVALAEPLDPIRVTVDRDLRRPFWIEHMDTFPFIVVDRIQLEREVDHARVIVDGLRIPESWLREEGVVELSRDRIQSWLDSLATSGVVPQRDGAYR